jgi:glucokinase
MAQQKYRLGIDIGGTNTVWGIVSDSGECLFEGTMPTQTQPSFDLFMDDLATNLINTLSQSQVSVLGVGIGAPNANYLRGTIEHAPNLVWKGILPIAKMLSSRMNLPVYVTNDANAAAIGEKKYGAAQSMNDFIMITLGTGLGSGIVCSGQLVYGHDGFAGELGHMIVEPGGRLCGCTRQGCLETYVSATIKAMQLPCVQ